MENALDKSRIEGLAANLTNLAKLLESNEEYLQRVKIKTEEYVRFSNVYFEANRSPNKNEKYVAKLYAQLESRYRAIPTLWRQEQRRIIFEKHEREMLKRLNRKDTFDLYYNSESMLQNLVPMLRDMATALDEGKTTDLQSAKCYVKAAKNDELEKSEISKRECGQGAGCQQERKAIAYNNEALPCVILKSVYINYFGLYKDAEFSFKEKLNVLCGKDIPGKTTFLQAIVWCIQHFAERQIPLHDTWLSSLNNDAQARLNEGKTQEEVMNVRLGLTIDGMDHTFETKWHIKHIAKNDANLPAKANEASEYYGEYYLDGKICNIGDKTIVDDIKSRLCGHYVSMDFGGYVYDAKDVLGEDVDFPFILDDSKKGENHMNNKEIYKIIYKWLTTDGKKIAERESVTKSQQSKYYIKALRLLIHLPKPSAVSEAEMQAIAHEILSGCFEIFYGKECGDKKLFEYARMLVTFPRDSEKIQLQLIATNSPMLPYLSPHIYEKQWLPFK